MKKHILAAAALAVLLAACGKKEEAAPAPAPTPVAAAPAAPAGPVLDAEKTLNIYNWPDYVPEGMIAAFEKETGIKVNYDTFETNEALNAKLVAGNTGYDIVVPGTVFAPGQIQGGLMQPLKKDQIPNLANMDPAIMATLTKADPGNAHLVPWAWGFTTVGINKTKVEKALGGMAMPENAWDLVFNPEYTSKLKSCGIADRDHSGGAALHRQGRLFQRSGRLQGSGRHAGQGAQGRAHVQLDHDRRHRRRQGLRGDCLVG
jgi:putrescine transport system substrate-binding protein